MRKQQAKSWGGRRPGAGKPKGKGKYFGMETKVIRIPVKFEKEILEFAESKAKEENSS